jgi:hypothetical protein
VSGAGRMVEIPDWIIISLLAISGKKQANVMQ